MTFCTECDGGWVRTPDPAGRADFSRCRICLGTTVVQTSTSTSSRKNNVSNTERDLYEHIRRNLPLLDWQRIESDTGMGIPDCSYVEGWAELKTTDGWKVTFRPNQPGWILRRTRRGGRVRVVIRQMGAGRDVLWVVPGLWVRQLAEGGLQAMDSTVPRWSGGPSQWPWPAVQAALQSP